jgi:hypothetical protein
LANDRIALVRALEQSLTDLSGIDSGLLLELTLVFQ